MGLLDFGPENPFPKNTWSYYFNTSHTRGKFNVAICLCGFLALDHFIRKVGNDDLNRFLRGREAREAAAAAKAAKN